MDDHKYIKINEGYGEIQRGRRELRVGGMKGPFESKRLGGLIFFF